MNEKIEKLRSDIDAIDARLISLLCERFEIVKEIADIKRDLQIEIEDEGREREVMENCTDAAEGRLEEGFVRDLAKLILSYSKKIQHARRGR
ncbi:MAG: chorismate mutase [Candidatus Hydrothermarchaeales archaeon]